MSTPHVNPVNAEPQFLSVSGLAEMLGLDKAGVSRKVSRLEAQGLVETRAGGAGRPKLVNVAAFLSATEQTFDAVRAANSAIANPDVVKDPVLAREQARGAAIRADLAQIELDKQRGLLAPIDDVREAMARAGGELVRVLDTLPAKADDIVAAIGRSGVQGARAAIKDLVRDARERLAAAMTLLATEAAGDGEE